MTARTRLRRLRYWLWANTRQERPVRRLVGWYDELAAMNKENWAGLHYVDGTLRDDKGRFATLERTTK